MNSPVLDTTSAVCKINCPIATLGCIILNGEVERVINHLKNNKSPGINMITGETIKHGGDVFIDRMYKPCNMVWNMGKAPDERTKSILVVIHKKESMMK